MTGIIEIIGLRPDMIAVQTETGDYSILELIGLYSPEIGDVISGNLENLGRIKVRNLSQREDWDVYIEEIYASREAAQRMIS
jgi:hypothetical protein